MLGLVGECELESGGVSNCFPCQKSCEHNNTIRSQYGATGLYGSGTIIGDIIDSLLKQQEDTLQLFCDSSLDLESLVTLTGFNHCVPTLSSQGCETICGQQKESYEIQECEDCIELNADENYYLNVMKSYRMIKYPSRLVIITILDLFGWDVIYTPDAILIDVGGDDPLLASGMLYLLPAPIGVDFKIIGNC